MGFSPPAMRYRDKRGISPLLARGRVPRVLGKDCQRAGIAPTLRQPHPHKGPCLTDEGMPPSASSPNAGRVPALVEELEAKVDEGKECQDDQGQDHNERDAAHRTMRRFGWHLIWRIR